MAGGRPTKYKADYARQAKKLCELGATVPELAEFFEVNESTVHLWMVKFKQFSKAVKAGREPADNRVEASLYKRAIGYEQDTVKVMQFKGEPVIIPYRERIAPDVAACIFWLKNRRPEEWRANPTPEEGELAPPLQITFSVKEPASEIQVTNAGSDS